MSLDILERADQAVTAKNNELAAALSGNDMMMEAAKLAGRGYRVFPLAPRSKEPVKGSRGLLEATTNTDQIAKWWREIPEANIGIATGDGLVVLDVDPAKGGADSLLKLDIPETLSVITGSGGLHYYFRTDHEIRNSASKLGPGLDVRGDGGYVVAPPSIHPSGGAYVWDEQREKASWPFPVEEPTIVPATNKGSDEDVIPTGSRNDALSRVAGSLRRAGLKPEDIEEQLLKVNLERCDPPLPEREVRNIAKSIGRYDPAPVPEGPEIMARSSVDFLQVDIPAPEWLVENVWPEQGIGFVAGPPKSFKSFYVLEMAFAIATGNSFIGRFAVPASRTVLLIQAESAFGAFKERVKSAQAHYGQAPSLYIISNRPLSLEDDEDLDRLKMEIGVLRPALVILDPLASFIKSDENSTQAMGGVVRTLRGLRDEFGTGFCIVHHSRKTDPSTTRGGEGMRGSSALYAASEAAAWIRRVGDDVPRSHIKFELKDGQGPEGMTLQFGDDGLKVINQGELLAEGFGAFKKEPYWNGD